MSRGWLMAETKRVLARGFLHFLGVAQAGLRAKSLAGFGLSIVGWSENSIVGNKTVGYCRWGRGGIREILGDCASGRRQNGLWFCFILSVRAVRRRLTTETRVG